MRYLALALTFVGGVGMTGCAAFGPTGAPTVPFRTLVQDGRSFGGEEKTLIVLQSAAEAATFLGPDAHFPEQVDYAAETVIGVQLGRRGHTGYSVEIRAIESGGGAATVYAVETDHGGGYTTFSYPAHFVVTRKLAGPVTLAPISVEQGYSSERTP